MKLLVPPQSGSIAGQTASRNRFGQYVRTRAVPVNPGSTRQTLVRSVFSGCSTNWAGLTDPEQEAWQAWSDNHPRIDSLGQAITLTGFQQFVAVNCALLDAGLPAVTAPPLDPLPDPPIILSATADDTPTFDVEFTPDPVPASTYIIVSATPPRSLGTQYDEDYRFITFGAPTSASPVDLSVLYPAKFGALTAGQRIFVKAKLLRADGGYSEFSQRAVVDVT